MIRDVVLHMQGDQPMVADIESLPTADDSTLVCTNLRTIERRKPLTVDHMDSVFIIPLIFIRFIEIPRAAILAAGLGGVGGKRAPALPAGAVVVAQPAHGDILGAPFEEVPEDDEGPEDEDPYAELEPDEELLRRIREA
jgi:hypothetical protein